MPRDQPSHGTNRLSLKWLLTPVCRAITPCCWPPSIKIHHLKRDVTRTMAIGRVEPPCGPDTGTGWMRLILFAALEGDVPAAADSASGGLRLSAMSAAVEAGACSPACPAAA